MSAQNDAAFLRMFLIILGALVAFTVIILIVANAVAGVDDEARADDPRLRAAIAERIAPVGRVNLAPTSPAPADAAAPAVATAAPAAAPTAVAAPPAVAAPTRSGEEVYNAACTACHLVGVLGSPKLGDTAAWSARLDAAGLDGLVSSVINGKGNMPARAGANVSDAEIRVAVEHMLTASGVEFEAPTASAAGAGPAAPATSTAAPAAAAPAETTLVAAAAPATAPATAEVDLAKGKSVYDTACFACHATGAAGAPKLGDQALWAPRIAKGMETLNHNAINGIGAMPAKGGRVDLPDADIASAVAYMIEQSK